MDSGAQSSIMSQDCARRCNLLHLLDKRFQGMAVGVGSGKIVGQIHQVPCCESAVHAACCLHFAVQSIPGHSRHGLSNRWLRLSGWHIASTLSPVSMGKACALYFLPQHCVRECRVLQCGRMCRSLRGCRVQAIIKVQSVHLPMSITVLESGSMEFLFGLDMLRRYQCCIDLKRGVLRVDVAPPVELPFLAEHELPPSARPGAGAGAPEEGAPLRSVFVLDVWLRTYPPRSAGKYMREVDITHGAAPSGLLPFCAIACLLVLAQHELQSGQG